MCVSATNRLVYAFAADAVGMTDYHITSYECMCMSVCL